MDLQYVKYLKYGNSLIHVGTKEEFVFDKMDENNNITLILKKDWYCRTKKHDEYERIIINIADMVFYNPNSKIRIIDGHYHKLIEINELEDLYIIENNKPIGAVKFLMYGSDDYHIIPIPNDYFNIYYGTMHIGQFGEMIERNYWKVMNLEGLIECLKV